MKNYNNKKGFTLIELLVVIAIISLLASVIIVSLSSAKLKAKDARIKQEMDQLRTFANLNFAEYGDYCYLQSASWISNNSSCSTGFASGAYATSVQTLCNDIIQSATDDPGYIPGSYPVGALRLYANNTVGCATSYSFMTYLNKGRWYCIGSSGRSGEYTLFDGNPGCHNNP